MFHVKMNSTDLQRQLTKISPNTKFQIDEEESAVSIYDKYVTITWSKGPDSNEVEDSLRAFWLANKNKLYSSPKICITLINSLQNETDAVEKANDESSFEPIQMVTNLAKYRPTKMKITEIEF